MKRYSVLVLALVVALHCAVGQNRPLVTKAKRFNFYNWNGGQRYRWAISADAKARSMFPGDKVLVMGNNPLVYCHPMDAPQYRILVLRVRLGNSFFGGEPMDKFLYERGFTKVLYMTHGDTTYVDTYSLTPEGKQLSDPLFKKYGTLLGPGKYVNNTGTADARCRQVGSDIPSNNTVDDKTNTPTIPQTEVAESKNTSSESSSVTQDEREYLKRLKEVYTAPKQHY